MWDEFEALAPSPTYDCEKSKGLIVKFFQRQKLFQFLMELNESYLQAISQILLTNPLPSLNQVYPMIIGDGGQKVVVTSSNSMGMNSMASTSGYKLPVE